MTPNLVKFAEQSGVNCEITFGVQLKLRQQLGISKVGEWSGVKFSVRSGERPKV